MLIHIMIQDGLGESCKESIEVDCTDTIKWLKDEISKTMRIRLLPVIPFIQPFCLIYAGRSLVVLVFNMIVQYIYLELFLVEVMAGVWEQNLA